MPRDDTAEINEKVAEAMSRMADIPDGVGYTPKRDCTAAIDEKIGWHLDRVNDLRRLREAVKGMGYLPDAIHDQIGRSMFP